MCQTSLTVTLRTHADFVEIHSYAAPAERQYESIVIRLAGLVDCKHVSRGFLVVTMLGGGLAPPPRSVSQPSDPAVFAVTPPGQMTNIDEVLGVTSPEAAAHERAVTDTDAAAAKQKQSGGYCSSALTSLSFTAAFVDGACFRCVSLLFESVLEVQLMMLDGP